MPARGAHWAARETASKRRFISLAGVGVCQEGGDWSPVACLPVGQALVWQEKFAKSLQTTFALSSLAIHFTASLWRGGLLLGAWCLVEVLLPDYQTCNSLDLSGPSPGATA